VARARPSSIESSRGAGRSREPLLAGTGSGGVASPWWVSGDLDQRGPLLGVASRWGPAGPLQGQGSVLFVAIRSHDVQSRVSGKVSVDDWPMLTWFVWGCTGILRAQRPPGPGWDGTVEITLVSTFMVRLGPDPVCHHVTAENARPSGPADHLIATPLDQGLRPSRPAAAPPRYSPPAAPSSPYRGA